MPLLMCPNCQSGMKEINREGVQIDMCPQCHGVWLDRGELQKLMDAVREDSAPAPQQQAPQQSYAPPPQQQQQHYQQQPYPQQRHYKHDDDDDYHRRHHGHHGYRKKSKMESIFDIFD